MKPVDFPAESIVIGRLSLSSFVKLCVIASLGVLPVIGLLALVGLGIGLVHSGVPGAAQDFPSPSLVWYVVLLKIGSIICSTLLTGAFFGLAGYPFYSWLCRHRGGIILRGGFWGQIINPMQRTGLRPVADLSRSAGE